MTNLLECHTSASIDAINTNVTSLFNHKTLPISVTLKTIIILFYIFAYGFVQIGYTASDGKNNPSLQKNQSIENIAIIFDKSSINHELIIKGLDSFISSHTSLPVKYHTMNISDLTDAELSENIQTYPLVISIDLIPTQRILKLPSVPRIFTLNVSQIDLDIFRTIYPQYKDRISGIYLEQPFERFIIMLKKLWPQHKKIGILLSQKTKPLKSRIDKLLKSYQLSPIVITTRYNDSPIKIMAHLAHQSDVVIAISDESLYSIDLFYYIIATLHDKECDFIGTKKLHHPFYKNISSIYTDPYLLGQELGKHIKTIVTNQFKMPEPGFPTTFSVNVSIDSRNLSEKIASDKQSKLKNSIVNAINEI